jgi:hypothetical protein
LPRIPTPRMPTPLAAPSHSRAKVMLVIRHRIPVVRLLQAALWRVGEVDSAGGYGGGVGGGREGGRWLGSGRAVSRRDLAGCVGGSKESSRRPGGGRQEGQKRSRRLGRVWVCVSQRLVSNPI